MKYGIIVDGKVTEPVVIPGINEIDPLAWLAVQFPGYSGWVEVSEDAVPGATYNGPGSSTNPSIPTPTVVNSWDEFDFRKRFTQAERKAIKQATKTNQDVEDFVDVLSCAGRTGTMIKANDALLNAALDALTAGGLLGPGRKDEILGA